VWDAGPMKKWRAKFTIFLFLIIHNITSSSVYSFEWDFSKISKDLGACQVRLLGGDTQELPYFLMWLARPDVQVPEVIKFLSQNPEYKKIFGQRNSDGRPLRQHLAEMGELYQIYRYHYANTMNSLRPLLTGIEIVALMKLIIAVHDLKKFEMREKFIDEYQELKELIATLFRDLGLNPEHIKLAQALVGHDLLGSLAKDEGSIETDEVYQNLKKMAADLGLPLAVFFDLQLLVYTCDVGSYQALRDKVLTTNAAGRLFPRHPGIISLAHKISASKDPHVFQEVSIPSATKSLKPNATTKLALSRALERSKSLVNKPSAKVGEVSGGLDLPDEIFFKGFPPGVKILTLAQRKKLKLLQYTKKVDEIVNTQRLLPGARPYIDADAHQRVYYNDLTGIFLSSPVNDPQNLQLGLTRASDYVEVEIDPQVPLLQILPGIYLIPLPESVYDWLLLAYQRWLSTGKDPYGQEMKFQRLKTLGGPGNNLFVPIKILGYQKNQHFIRVK
jgi:hypothetical protein